MRNLVFSFVLGIATLPAFSAANEISSETVQEQQIADIFNKSSLSLSKNNYRIHLLHRVGDTVDTLVNAHAIIDGEEREYISYLNGTPREVFRRGDAVTCVYPEGSSPMADRNLINSLMQVPLINQYQTLRGLYSFELADSDFVAGRKAIVINVVPIFGDRAGHRLWLDATSFLPLRHDVIDDRGVVTKQLMAVLLELEVAPIEKLSSPLVDYDDKLVHPLSGKDRELDLDSSQWEPKWLPQGFTKVATEKEAPGSSGHILYSDGIARFSVYIERNISANMHSRVFRHQGNTIVEQSLEPKTLVTVIGDISPRTAETVISSISLERPHG